jgi:hypothetical protein
VIVAVFSLPLQKLLMAWQIRFVYGLIGVSVTELENG